MTSLTAKPGILRVSRLNTLIIVLALHLGVLLLLFSSRVPEPPALAPQNAIEIVYLPPTIAPKVKAGTPQLQHVVLDPGISLSPRTLDAAFASPPASQPDGEGGPGVNWIAEAHRAVKAFEIRRDEHVVHDGLGLSPWEGWLPKGAHHPGEKYRTPSGDWIVWISTN